MKTSILFTIFSYYLLVTTITVKASATVTANPNCTPKNCQTELKHLNEFHQLSTQQSSVSGVKSMVKVVYYRDPGGQGEGQIYFMNTKQYSYHWDFVTQALKIPISLEQFNLNYEGNGEGRAFNLGTLTYWTGIGAGENAPAELILLELWSGDGLEGEYLAEFFQKIKERLKMSVPLLYHPLSVRQEKSVEKGGQDIPYVTNDQLYQNQQHQILSEGVAYGYLKIIGEDENLEDICLDQTHIPVFKKAPNDIGLVAGIVTEEFQTPLSHINIKSLNRGTVNLALKGATEKLAAFNHAPVQLEVSGNGYKITPLSEDVIKAKLQQFWKQKRPQTALRPQSLIGTAAGRNFIPLQKLFTSLDLEQNHEQHRKYISLIGAKATHLAWLHAFLGKKAEKELGVYVPQGYAIPFDFYEEFMNTPQKGLNEKDRQIVSTPATRILEIMEDGGLLEDNFQSLCKAKPYLKAIREMIAKAQVPSSVLKQMKKHIFEEGHSPIHQSRVAKIRLRSSTNAEDLEGFSGAGLYLSTGLSLYEEEGDIPLKGRPLTWEKVEKKLRKKIPSLYASVWNDRAYEESEWFGLNGRNHLDVKVGLLLHRAFPKYDWDALEGEGGNGVALSKNIYNRNEFEKIYINGQHDDFPITNPPSKEELLENGEDPSQIYTTEQVLVTPYLADTEESNKRKAWKEWPYEFQGRSSLRQGAYVLQDDPDERSDFSSMEIRRLARAIEDLNLQFARLYQKRAEEFIIDTEWKVYGRERQIWIKQARPLIIR